MAAVGPILLNLHRESHSALASISAIVLRTESDRLEVKYEVRGALRKIVWPATKSATRQDELWRHTCFEAFIRNQGKAYDEFNFSPSSDWAAYRFDDYRTGMHPIDTPPPAICSSHVEDSYALSATFSISPEARALALSAVIEEGRDERSYWALAHGPGKPDFHHPDSFAIDLRDI